MLTDRTNAPPAVGKVFSRRGKSKETSEDKSGRHDQPKSSSQESTAPSPAATAPSPSPDPSPSPSPSPADSTYDSPPKPLRAWMRKLHRNRRGSVLLPYPCALGDEQIDGTLALLTQQQLLSKRAAGRQAHQRVAAYAEFLDSMSTYFNEVDSFELAVESPGADRHATKISHSRTQKAKNKEASANLFRESSASDTRNYHTKRAVVGASMDHRGSGESPGDQCNDRGAQHSQEAEHIDQGSQPSDQGPQHSDQEAEHNDQRSQPRDQGAQPGDQLSPAWCSDQGSQPGDQGAQPSDQLSQHSDQGAQHSDQDAEHSDQDTEHSDQGSQHSDQLAQHSDLGAQHSGASTADRQKPGADLLAHSESDVEWEGSSPSSRQAGDVMEDSAASQTLLPGSCHTSLTPLPGPCVTSQTPLPGSCDTSQTPLSGSSEKRRSSVVNITAHDDGSSSSEVSMHGPSGSRRSSVVPIPGPQEGRRSSTVPVPAPQEGQRGSAVSVRAPQEGRRGSSQHSMVPREYGRRSSVLVPMPGLVSERRSSVQPSMQAIVDGRKSSVQPPTQYLTEAHRSSVTAPLPGARRSSVQAPMQGGADAHRSSVTAPLPGMAVGRRSSVSASMQGVADGRRSSIQPHMGQSGAIPEEEEDEGVDLMSHVHEDMLPSVVTDQLNALSLEGMQSGVIDEGDEEEEGENVVAEVGVGEDGGRRSLGMLERGLSMDSLPDRLVEGETADVGSSPRDASLTLTPMQQLLEVCGQNVDLDQIPSMDELIGGQAELKKIIKIGEGTYGEAFKYAGPLSIVFKIIPIEGEQLVNEAVQKKAGEMAAEVAISLTLSALNHKGPDTGPLPANSTAAFVETFKVGVCCGRYSKQLIKAWHEWDKRHGSESDPVDSLATDQAFLVISMADCGTDLEKFTMPGGYDQALALLAQVGFALAVAEEAVEFEHRDLHWGNVMVKPAESTSTLFRLRGVDIQVPTLGVNACIIDFTASRLRTLQQQLAFCDLSQDPELFEGPKGNVQHMRKLNGDEWASSHMATNCLWMSYLAEIVATEKLGTSSKSNRGVTQQKKVLREFRKRAVKYSSCGEMVLADPLFQGLWAVLE
eukprot:gene14639-20675_t